MIAGHTFPDFGPCACGMRWTTIRNTEHNAIGQPGIAHTGNLNGFEYLQIEAARAGEDWRIMIAMEEVLR